MCWSATLAIAMSSTSMKAASATTGAITHGTGAAFAPAARPPRPPSPWRDLSPA